jgi:HAD superfamily hydrolase (TIGR01493 family)
VYEPAHAAILRRVPIRAVSLDLFDTLVDMHMDRLPRVEIAGRSTPSTYGLLHQASVQWHGLEFERFAAELGALDRELRALYYREDRELPTLERFLAFGRKIGATERAMAETLTRTHMGAVSAHVTHVDHHPELLGRLRRRVRLAVCSNFSHSETARSVLERAQLLGHFDPVVISEDVGIRKPRAEIFEAVLAGLRLAPGEVLHVGDSLSADVAGASARGLRTAWLTRRVPDAESALREYDGPRPDHVIADLAELEPLLERSFD